MAKKRGRKKKVSEEQIKLINSEEESEKLKHEMIDKENRELDIFYIVMAIVVFLREILDMPGT